MAETSIYFKGRIVLYCGEVFLDKNVDDEYEICVKLDERGEPVSVHNEYNPPPSLSPAEMREEIGWNDIQMFL